MKNLETKWSAAAAAGETLGEYPRPQLQRDSYYSLNGMWDYRIEREGTPVCAGEIRVPFAPECPLSGVQHILQPGETLTYEAKLDLPAALRPGRADRVLLHFGAVDQVCHVWVNDREVGSHAGGYTAFTCDITEALQEGENRLRVVVRDDTEQAPYGRGKQRLDHNIQYSSLFYTPVSGIWKSVWIERVPAAYIERLRITPRYDDAAVTIAIESAQTAAGQVEISLRSEVVARKELAPGQQEITIPLPDFEAWSPAQPTLYDVCIRFGDDAVRSYFGMRKVERRRDADGIWRFRLNDEPIFMNGVLDQGYWPDGLLTAPSDEALVYDIETLRSMGYNLIRKHIKVEPERFYYHCDRLGMLVWQDVPNGGGDYNMTFVATLPNAIPWIGRHLGDHHYAWFGRADAEGRRIYYQELAELVAELYNHPSIVAWVPFNEGWGQFDAQVATDRVREMDDTRLIDQACGWFDQGGGDMYAIHNYFWPLRTRVQRDRVLALTEYGGYALPVPGHLACEKEFGYKGYHSQEELTAAYEALIGKSVLAHLQNGLCAAIYTQVSDVEEEINGLMTYDRAVTKMDIEKIRAINARIYQRFAEYVEQDV